MAAVPSIGRAAGVEGAVAPEADLTRALYEQYGSQIFRYCLHQLGSREEAEDAVQSTFLNAFRGIKRGIVPELESAWLFKIAQNVCLSRRRSTWRRDRIESPTDFELVEELTPAPSRRADELMGLQDVLEQMPESQRRAILLREWQGLSYREIADELELSQAAVETLIFRARRALAQGLEQPPAPKKRRALRGADWGNVLAGLKSLLFGGGAAVKVAATVAVVSATTVVAAAPVVQHQASRHRATRTSTPARSQAASSQSAAAAAAAAPGPATSAGVGFFGRTSPHRAAAGQSLAQRAVHGVPAPDGGVPPAPDGTAAAGAAPDATQPPAPAPEAPGPAPLPAVGPAASAPASNPGNGQSGDAGQTETTAAAPVEVKKDASSSGTVVAPVTIGPTGTGSGDSSGSSSGGSSQGDGGASAAPAATPTQQQTTVVAPTTTMPSATPPGANGSSPSLVLPPTLTKQLDTPPATSTSPPAPVLPGIVAKKLDSPPATTQVPSPTASTSSSAPPPTQPVPPTTLPATSVPPSLAVQPPATTSGDGSGSLSGVGHSANP